MHGQLRVTGIPAGWVVASKKIEIYGSGSKLRPTRSVLVQPTYAFPPVAQLLTLQTPQSGAGSRRPKL